MSIVIKGSKKSKTDGPFKVTDMIFEGIKSLNDQKQAKFVESRVSSEVPSTVIYASSIGYCARRWAFNQVIGREKDGSFSKETLLIFADGDATEDTLLKALNASSTFRLTGTQRSHVSSLPNNEHWQVRGRSDIEGVDLTSGVAFPIEVKSMNIRNFSSASVFGGQKAHFAQLAFYVYVGNFTIGRLLYKEKDSAQMQEFELNYQEAEEITTRNLDLYSQAVDSLSQGQGLLPLLGKVPAELTTPDECKYCKYAVECSRASVVKDEGLPF